ncbi:hypothetical protein [Paremcibacter congregatus]|uniref:Uncharacterized protein n=1 Tax=Paremcibacter congregatus TaxID=2043170 RepID=A0A2G4YMY2_9PROT|nr:hypothetical protein [Paremcibacter congregatus]PHZ83671.1 hypothetical protein CRD36_14940 [Paremcibacter congregatus]QDE27374.1 hypothetical protein FIV45_08765 [Paremcibacter congregatus]
MKLAELTHNKYLKTRLAIIFILSGLLILYHLSKVVDLYIAPGITEASPLLLIQSAVRIAIASTLLLVVFGQKRALWGMWIAITALTVTRYILLLQTEPLSGIEFTTYLSYLRGFIFPTIITLCYPTARRENLTP